MLFLDEPTVGLDPRIRHELLDVIAGLRGAGEMTILLTTHYLDEAERLCDRVAIVARGRIVALDTPQALLAALGREIVELRVDGEPPSARWRRCASRGDRRRRRVRRRLDADLPLHGRPRRDAIAAIDELGTRPPRRARGRPTLDDVYLRLTGGRLAGRLTTEGDRS